MRKGNNTRNSRQMIIVILSENFNNGQAVRESGSLGFNSGNLA